MLDYSIVKRGKVKYLNLFKSKSVYYTYLESSILEIYLDKFLHTRMKQYMQAVSKKHWE